MTACTMFFTDKDVDGVVKGKVGNDRKNYRYKDMRFYNPGLDYLIIPDMIQYGVGQGSYDWPIFDLAKEYLRKVGNDFIVMEICLGYETPPHTVMSELTLDLNCPMIGEWPQSLLDTLPEKSIIKDYNPIKGGEELCAHSPTKKNPYFELFVEYRLIDSSITR